jgi:hypothetical protein
VRSESRCALVLRYVDLVVSIENGVEVTPPGFYLWGAASSAVYSGRPRTLNEFKTAKTYHKKICRKGLRIQLTLSVLMSYIYMELLVKPQILTSYICGHTFGNAESRLFLFPAQCFNIESMQKVILCHSCV